MVKFLQYLTDKRDSSNVNSVGMYEAVLLKQKSLSNQNCENGMGKSFALVQNS